MRTAVTVAALAGLAVSTTALAQNTGARLTDGTALYDVTSSGSSGTIPTTAEPSGTSLAVQGNFRINGGTSGTDNVYANWWWYRTSTDTRELAIRQASGTATRTLTGTNQVDYVITATNASLSFNVMYRVVQHSPVEATMTTSVTVTNVGAGPVTGLNLFNMLDIFLNGQDANDRVLSAGVVGTDRVINWEDTVAAIGNPLKYAVWTGVGATGYGAGDFAGISTQVTDTGIDNFNDVITSNPPAGQDMSGVLQWNFGDLLPGGSVTATARLYIPSPGALALLGLGGLLAGRRRR
jgi:hypothetical protein